MSSPDSSSLSSARSTDDESVAAAVNRSIDLKRYFKPQTDAACPSPPKRPASPPHEYVLADNPDIAVSCQMNVIGLNFRVRRELLVLENVLICCCASLVRCNVPREVQRRVSKGRAAFWTAGY